MQVFYKKFFCARQYHKIFFVNVRARARLFLNLTIGKRRARTRARAYSR